MQRRVRLPPSDTASPSEPANRNDLTGDQEGALGKLKRRSGGLWWACSHKEARGVVFAGDLTEDEVGMLVDQLRSKPE